MYDSLKTIKTCKDLSFLIEMRDKWIPMDIANVEKNYPFEMEIRLIHKNSITPDELKRKKLEGINFVLDTVKKRISTLQKK